MYQHILIALDLHPDRDHTTEKKALEMQKKMGAQLSVVHALERLHLYGPAYAYAPLSELEDKLFADAKSHLQARARALGLPVESAHLEMGPAKQVILEVADRLNVDLIMIGSHSRHGIQMLLPSITDGVLHNASCDLLAVRLADE